MAATFSPAICWPAAPFRIRRRSRGAVCSSARGAALSRWSCRPASGAPFSRTATKSSCAASRSATDFAAWAWGSARGSLRRPPDRPPSFGLAAGPDEKPLADLDLVPHDAVQLLKFFRSRLVPCRDGRHGVSRSHDVIHGLLPVCLELLPQLGTGHAHFAAPNPDR